MTAQTPATQNRFYAGLLKFVLLGILFLPVQLLAQKKFSGTKVDPAREASLAKVFRKYTLFNINMAEIARHTKAGGKGTVNLVLDFPEFDQLSLSVNEQDIFSGDYQLVVGNPGGRQKSAKPDIKTYSGKLAGDERSSVFLTISDKTFYGFIKGNGKEYYIEPLRYFDKKANPTTYVLYEALDVIPQSGVMCAVTEADQRDLTSSAPAASQMEALGTATGTCRRIEMAIASDASMVDKYGSVEAVEEHNISVLYMMVGLYGDAQIGSQYLEFSISGQYISTNTASDPYSPAYSGPDAQALLTNFSNWGFAGNFGFSYDLGQVWTTRDIGIESPAGSGNYSYSTIGLAWVGAVCNARYKHQLLEDIYSSSMAQAVVAAHETGHNLSAQHDASGAPYIMAPSTSATGYATTFSPASLTSMNNYLTGPTATCLSGCVPAPTIALFNMSSSNICTGNSITFTNGSVGENLSYSWSFPGGNPASSTDPNPVVSYSSSGTKTITLTVSNANGTSSKTKEIFVADAPGSACSQNTAGNGTLSALFSFSLRDIQYSTNTYYLGRHFEDLACTYNTRLQPATNYSFISNTGFSAAGITNSVQLFIDYNNDGDFSDADESVYFSAGCVSGTSTNNFTTPANPPVKGAWLRLRFMTIPCGLPLSNGCTIPDNASVRDFAVYFPEECPVVQLPTAAEQATVNISGAGETMLRSATCGLIGAILPNGANPVSGQVDAKVWVEPTVPTYAGLPYVARHYEITPAVNAATATGRVTLYFTQGEFDAYNAAPNSYAKMPTGAADALGIANLRIEKYPGSSDNGTGLPPTYAGAPVLLDPADTDIVWNSTQNRWEVSVDITGFSGFIVHGSLAPLPLRLLSFQASRHQQNVVLNWRTTAETGVSHFEIERSYDGIKFMPVSQVAALNTAGDQNYRYSDPNAVNLAPGNTIHYRLKMVDIDHRYTYSPVRRVALEGVAAISVYPNPVGNTLTVQMPVLRAGTTGIRLVDLQGRVIKNWNFSGTGGLLHLDVQAVPYGLYQLEISQGAGERRSYKVIKL